MGKKGQWTDVKQGCMDTFTVLSPTMCVHDICQVHSRGTNIFLSV